MPNRSLAFRKEDRSGGIRIVGCGQHSFLTLVMFAALSLVGFAVLSRPPVSRAATLTVMSNADAGGTCPGADCTLRQAILAAMPGDAITFSLPANSVITLTSGELGIAKNLTINGPGANLLTVQRNTGSGTPNFRIFNIAS